MKYSLIFIILLTTFSSFGQKSKAFLDSLSKKELKLLPIPGFMISPEVGVMYGMYIDYYYNTGGKKDTITRPSLSYFNILYSTKKQLNIETSSSVYTKNEKYYFSIRAGYFDDFEQYWGETYPVLKNEDYIDTRYKRYQTVGRFTKNLGKQHFVGLGYQFNKYFDFDFKKTKYSEFIPQNPNSTIFGTGLVYSLDRRNSQFSTTEGSYLDLSAFKMFDVTKKTEGYYQFNLDARNFLEYRKHVFANHFIIGTTSGAVPPFEKLRIGGSSILRGLFKGQFRDDNIWAFQTEYRYELVPFLKVVYFASIGNTAPTLNTLFKQNLIFGQGLGLRVRVNKKKKIYARFDYAKTNYQTDGFYMRLGEAF